MATKLPDGYIKMDLTLMYNDRASDILEKEVLKMIIRDYYVFYSKKPLAYLTESGKGGRKVRYFQFSLYCREDDREAA